MTEKGYIYNVIAVRLLIVIELTYLALVFDFIQMTRLLFTCGLVINNVDESLLGNVSRPHFFSENMAPDSIWNAFLPADAELSPL